MFVSIASGVHILIWVEIRILYLNLRVMIQKAAEYSTKGGKIKLRNWKFRRAGWTFNRTSTPPHRAWTAYLAVRWDNIYCSETATSMANSEG